MLFVVIKLEGSGYLYLCILLWLSILWVFFVVLFVLMMCSVWLLGLIRYKYKRLFSFVLEKSGVEYDFLLVSGIDLIFIIFVFFRWYKVWGVFFVLKILYRVLLYL